MSRVLVYWLVLLCLPMGLAAEETEPTADIAVDQAAQQRVQALDKPLYSPFVERYVLDELRQLRTDMGAQKSELIQKIVDRELTAVDRAVTYATDTITYFFYMIAAASSILVVAGWSSIRDIKERVHSLADEEIAKLVHEYEQRLQTIQKQLNQKSKHIQQNREEIELTQELHTLWLRAGQENNPANKIATYDQILKLRNDDCEALTYKADAVLELGEPQWAANLCHQALQLDPDNCHAFYQLGCAYTAMQQFEEAVRYLSEALKRTESYREEMLTDPALRPLDRFEPFKKLLPHEVS